MLKAFGNKRAIIGTSQELVKEKQGLVAVGDFEKKVMILDCHNKKLVQTIEGHLGSVNCIRTTEADSNLIITGARRDGLLYTWVAMTNQDLRKTSSFLDFYEREADTNQRLAFDVVDGQLVYGDTRGLVKIQSLTDKGRRSELHTGGLIVNSVEVVGKLRPTIALCTGERRFCIRKPQIAIPGNESPLSDDLQLWINEKEKPEASSLQVLDLVGVLPREQEIGVLGQSVLEG